MATVSTREFLPLKRRAVEATMLGLVAILSLLLLLYVAFEDARRTMERFHSEKMVAQGQVVQNALESFVRPGLPLRHFVGFSGLVEPIIDGDRLVSSVAAYAASGERVFAVGPAAARFDGPARLKDTRAADIVVSAGAIEVVLPLDDRFERVGHIVLVTPRALIATQVEAAFKPLLGLAMLAAAAFALAVALLFPRQDGPLRLRWVGIGFISTFAITAALVVATLVSTYSLATQERAKSLADSLGQRLDDIVAFNLSFNDITGIGALLAEYRRANPDIRAAALIVDGRVIVHTDAGLEGGAWDHRSDDYEFAADLSPNGTARIQIRVALPRDVVFAQVLRSTKNFSALLVASGLFAALFVGLVHAFQRRSRIGRDASDDDAKAFSIDLIKPAFFLAVFSEHLSYAFLPQIIQSATLAAGLSKAWASAPFTIYYLTFAMALIAAGRLEQRMSARSLAVGGLALSAVGMTLMAIHLDFQSAVLARALSGMGQGILFIGTQAFVLTNSSQARRTRSGSIIVFGFQAGMIAGMAIGSLLFSSIHAAGVFRLAAVVAGATALYVGLALPVTRSSASSVARASLWRDVLTLMRDGAFARTALLIGIPAKAILTGAVLLGLPLLLAQLGFAKEDIGQITMLYAGAVIISSQLASARADRTADTRTLLFHGACLTALGLFVIASPGLSVPFALDLGAWPVTALIICGVVTIGIAHGFINAPIVTHVAETAAAGVVGPTRAAATYRLLERVGHVTGPLVMMQIFAVMGVTWSAFATIGVGILIMALLFLSAGRTTTAGRSNLSAA